MKSTGRASGWTWTGYFPREPELERNGLTTLISRNSCPFPRSSVRRYRQPAVRAAETISASQKTLSPIEILTLGMRGARFSELRRLLGQIFAAGLIAFLIIKHLFEDVEDLG